MAFDWYYGPGGYKSEDTPYHKRDLAPRPRSRSRGCTERSATCALVTVHGKKFLCRIVKNGRLACSKAKGC